MRRRTASSIEDSTELLLDTICNTFGGILFISLLVVLLLNTSGPSSSREAQYTQASLDLLELDNLRDELVREELEVLHRELEAAFRQQEEYFKTAARPEDVKMVAIRQSLERQVLELLQRISETERSLTALEQEKIRSRSKLRETQEALQAASESSRVLQSEIKKQLEKNSRNLILRAAVARSSSGASTYIIEEGKLFGPFETRSGDFIVERGFLGGRYIKVNSSQGLRIPTDLDDLGAVRLKIGRIGSARVFVASDSYQSWKLVERVLQQSNVSYDAVPTGSSSVQLQFTEEDVRGFFQ
jgi:virulence-associated protein VagC